MTIVINLGLHGGRKSGIFITGIFGNFYTERGEFLTFKTGIPGGLACRRAPASRTFVSFPPQSVAFVIFCSLRMLCILPLLVL